jgi:hypothetical protein
MELKQFIKITNTVCSNYYKDLGIVEIIDDSTLENIKIYKILKKVMV